MNLIDCARTFVCVAELGAFARAADRLDLSTATASRHIAYLEEQFGARLLERTTRKIRLTEAGRLCLARMQRILDELDDLTASIQIDPGQPRGLLRVSSTTHFWMQAIAPALPGFLERFDQLGVHVNLTERIVDLLGEGYDLALQIERPTGHSIVARPLVHLTRVLYASPAYLARHGVPDDIDELAGHNCLVYAHSLEQVEWRFDAGPDRPDGAGTAGGERQIAVHGALRSNDANTLRLAGIAGLGIGRGPLFVVADDLRAGRLVRVLPTHRSVDPDLWVVYPSRRQLPPKVRLFIDFLVEACERSIDSGLVERVDPASPGAQRP